MKVSRLKNWLFCMAAILAISPGAQALNNDVDLGSPNDGPLQKIGALMQQIVDFLGGPGVLLVAVLGFVWPTSCGWSFPSRPGRQLAWLDVR